MRFLLQVSGEYRSDQNKLNASPVPGEKAYPLDQGESKTCTAHAIANAAADQLADVNVDINQRTLAQILVADSQSIEAVWPHFYNNYSTIIQLNKKINPGWIRIKINVQEIQTFSYMDKHVLAYHTRNEKTSHSYHCVFVKEQLEDYYNCVNSWGEDIDPHPKIEVDRPGNRLWRVRAEVEPAREGWSFVSKHS